MRILHYFLGFPTYRTGGLTRFAFDLMKKQVDDGNYVIALWPGEIRKYGMNPKIIRHNSANNIVNYEVVNPLPIPLDEGINKFEAYMSSCDIRIYEKFLKKIRPEIIHIHTLMGLHKEFIEAANNLGIKTVFTSHDYFGLCPKATLYRYGKCCDDDSSCRNCIQCNINALSLKKIQILQSPLYRWLKDTFLVKILRKKHRSDFFSKDELPPMPKVNVEEFAGLYRKLRAYYVWMYEHIDFIHFNSTVAESIYNRFIKPSNSKVISISHSGIHDYRESVRLDSEKFRVLFLAPARPYKGFEVLKQAMDELWNEGKKDIELKVYSPVRQVSPYMIVKESGFAPTELSNIFSEADVLVAASIWYETFGYTVLEALSYGVPVIVTDHVGAKDIISAEDKVVKSGSVSELKQAIIDYANKKSAYPNRHIKIKIWREFVNECYEMYR